jgi:hypothetical protein
LKRVVSSLEYSYETHPTLTVTLHCIFQSYLSNSSYIDDIFLTSNESIQSFRQILDDAKYYHRNIKFNYEIGSCVFS